MMRLYLLAFVVLILSGVALAEGPFDTPVLLRTIEQETYEIEKHLHGNERWYGRRYAQTPVYCANGDTLGSYRAVSGDNAYGGDAADTAYVFGSGDITAAYFDMHRIDITNASAASPYRVQVVYGIGTFAAALAAGQYTEFMFEVATAAGRLTESELMMPRLPNGTKVWLRCKNATNNATMDFFVGVHTYLR